MIRMPGTSYRGPFDPLTPAESRYRDELTRSIEILCGTIGDRGLHRYRQFEAAAAWLEEELAKTGRDVHRQSFAVDGVTCHNLEIEFGGSARPDEIVVVGAHYDTVPGSPGANDNGTGAAAVLSLARAFSERRSERTVRFVEFANEESPYFYTDSMGSLAYAKRARMRNERVVVMLSLETMGYFSDDEGSQKYPLPGLSLAYPTRGNFIAFVANVASRGLLRESVGAFRSAVKFPSEAAALPGAVPGVGWSDQWAFWHEGYPGIMITDTAPFRYPHYHLPSDTPDKIQYDKLARVVAGLEAVIAKLARSEGT